MKNLQNTYTTAQIGEKMRLIDFDTIKGLAQKVTVPLLPKYTKSFSERCMNRIGWYRQSEWYFIDSHEFMRSVRFPKHDSLE